MLRAQEMEKRSVSYKPVGPPKWARLPSDTTPAVYTVSPLPGHFPLGDDPLCRCGAPPVDNLPIRSILCTLYTSVGPHKATIEVLPCSQCPRNTHMFAGPDLGHWGIFNMNNVTLYSHELLNEYSNRYTSGETTFDGFCLTLRRSYMERGTSLTFVSKGVLEKTWFALSNVQKLVVSFSCPECGSHPDTVVCDGLTAGYCAKYLTSTLQPPTMPTKDSITRYSVRPLKCAALVPTKIRKEALSILRFYRALRSGKQTLCTPRDQASDALDADIEPERVEKRKRREASKKKKAEAARLMTCADIVGNVAEVNIALAAMLGMYLNGDMDAPDKFKLYGDLLQQLLAHESVLQFAPEETWSTLQALASIGYRKSTERSALEDIIERLLVLVPAVGNVAHHELAATGRCSRTLCKVIDFVVEQATEVTVQLSGHDYNDAAVPKDSVQQEDFVKSGSVWPTPRERNRPIYARMKDDGKVERSVVSEEGIGCPKHYEAYGKKGLTGGIMALWCTHCICIGFHCIPKGEGRNDVFSALFTQWPSAPKVVIYDFACALAPYCMLRESKFFKNTKFLIDDFHAMGHTKCSKACFLSNYTGYDLDIEGINSSAAECGNSGLRRIRKSMSYMRQDHAIIFVYVFLALWNRNQHLHNEKLRRYLAAG